MEDIKETYIELLEMKTTLHGINIRLDTTEGKISELEDTKVETIQNEIQRGKKKESVKKKRTSVSCGLWDNCRMPNTHLSGVFRGKGRDTQNI